MSEVSGRRKRQGTSSRLHRGAFSIALAAAAFTAPVPPLRAQQPAKDPLAQATQLIAAKDWAGAKAALQAQLKTDPGLYEARFLLGYIYFHEQDPKQSLAEYTLGAAGRRPTAAEFRIIGADYVLFNDLPDADRWFTEATKEDPTNASSWYLLGRAQYNEGKCPDAVNSFQHVLALRPDDFKAEDNLGLSYQALNQLPEAKAAFEKAIAMQQGSVARSGAPYLDLGELLLQMNQPAQAQEALRTAAALSPDNPKAHEQFGIALQRANNLEEARAELEKAAALAPNASPVHFELGQVCRRLGLNDEAKKELALCEHLTATKSSQEVPNIEHRFSSDEPMDVPAAGHP